MSMSNIVEEWNNARIRYQNRYYGACKKLKTGETNTDNHGAMLEMSYVLISIFGLSPKEVDEVEKNGGFTNKDLKKIEEETEKYVNVHKFDDGCFTSVKLDKLVIKAGMRVNFHAFSETSINELEFIDDAGKSAKTVVDLYAFENAKVGRLIIPDHMYDRFKEVIAKMR